MDFTKVDMKVLAPQLRKPEGEFGREVGQRMAGYNNEVIAFSIECLDVQPTDHILEIGFGPGEGIAQLVQITPQGFVAGIDYSEVMLDMASDRNHRAMMEEAVELTLGEAAALPYADEGFDKILCVNVFHFWKDPTKELAECLRVMKPGGRIAFFMAYPSSWLPGLRATGVFIEREPSDVETMFRTAGFQNVEHRDFTLNDYKSMKEYKGFSVMGMK